MFEFFAEVCNFILWIIFFHDVDLVWKIKIYKNFSINEKQNSSGKENKHQGYNFREKNLEMLTKI